MMIQMEKERKNINSVISGIRRAAAVSVLLILMVSLITASAPYLAGVNDSGAAAAAVYAADEEGSGESEGTAEEQAAPEYAYGMKPTGEAVKCKGGTLVDPVGDMSAEAPDIKAECAVLYSLDLGEFVYSKNADKKIAPYSTTKILTCWLALQNLDKEQVVTVSENATQVYEAGTTIWLKPGEKIRVIDLVYGAMLESGNDAAYALGEAVAGSESDFADLMNRTVAEWGCENTHFVNANGWKNEDHYTTVHDMAVIMTKCLENKELMDISITKEYTAPATNLTSGRDMENRFLGVIDNDDIMTCGKTGSWSEDDCGLVASFTEGGLSEVMVILGDTEKGRTKDAKILADYSHLVTPGYAVPAAGSNVKTVWVRHGEKTRVDLVADGATYAYPAENKARAIRTEIETEKLEAPVKKGQEAGKISVYLGDELIGEHKLVASEDIKTGWLPSYLYISNKATLNALKVIGLFILLLLIVSTIGRKSAKRRRAKKEARKRLREKYRSKH